MASWLSRIFGWAGGRSTALPSGQAEPADGQGVEEDAPPAWAEELGETAQKVSRAMVRLSVRVEELERKVEGGFADLRAREQERASPADRAAAEEALLDFFLDFDEGEPEEAAGAGPG